MAWYECDMVCVWNPQNMMVQLPQVHRHGNYDNNGNGWYVDDDKKMGYQYIQYIISIP